MWPSQLPSPRLGMARPVQYRQIPLTIDIRREGAGKRLVEQRTELNGKPVAKAEVADLANVEKLQFEIVRVHGK